MSGKILFCLCFLVIGLVGCGDFAFVRTIAVDDDDFDAKVMSSRAPVVVLFHSGPGSNAAHTWGSPMERFAAAVDEKVSFAHYDVRAQGQWFRDLGMNVAGSPVLFVRGTREGAIGAYMPSVEGRVAQLFMMLDSYVLPGIRLGGFRDARVLKPQFFVADVIEAAKPVILAFDRCSGGG